MPKYTDDEVLASIRRVVEGKGADYVYEAPTGASDCLYVVPRTKAKPSCIVGHVLADLGEIGVLKELGGIEARHGVANGWFCDAEQAEGAFSPAVNSALEAAQSAQDSRETWGDALERFEIVLEAVTR